MIFKGFQIIDDIVTVKLHDRSIHICIVYTSRNHEGIVGSKVIGLWNGKSGKKAKKNLTQPPKLAEFQNEFLSTSVKHI